MLFASTQRTLVKDLGAEHFGETFFTTEASELSADGWAKHEAHSVAEQPLTQEERDKEVIREAELQEQGGMSRRGAGYGTSRGNSGAMNNVGGGVEDTLRKFGEGSAPGDLVQLVCQAMQSKAFVRLTSNRKSTFRPRLYKSSRSPLTFRRHPCPAPYQRSSRVTAFTGTPTQTQRLRNRPRQPSSSTHAQQPLRSRCACCAPAPGSALSSLLKETLV